MTELKQLSFFIFTITLIPLFIFHLLANYRNMYYHRDWYKLHFHHELKQFQIIINLLSKSICVAGSASAREHFESTSILLLDNKHASWKLMYTLVKLYNSNSNCFELGTANILRKCAFSHWHCSELLVNGDNKSRLMFNWVYYYFNVL